MTQQKMNWTEEKEKFLDRFPEMNLFKFRFHETEKDIVKQILQIWLNREPAKIDFISCKKSLLEGAANEYHLFYNHNHLGRIAWRFKENLIIFDFFPSSLFPNPKSLNNAG